MKMELAPSRTSEYVDRNVLAELFLVRGQRPAGFLGLRPLGRTSCEGLLVEGTVKLCAAGGAAHGANGGLVKADA